jgi:methylmalonyl-CoA mutase, N-terminal domain
VVGLNKFQVKEEEKPKDLLKVDPEVGNKQLARLKELKSSRDEAAVKKALADVKAAAEGTANMMYPILTAVTALATLGEICDTLRGVWGEYEMTVF